MKFSYFCGLQCWQHGSFRTRGHTLKLNLFGSSCDNCLSWISSILTFNEIIYPIVFLFPGMLIVWFFSAPSLIQTKSFEVLYDFLDGFCFSGNRELNEAHLLEVTLSLG